MPFVQRDETGAIKGLFANPQPGYAEEILPDDDPQVTAFREAHPAPPMPTFDPEAHREEAKRLIAENEAIRETMLQMSFAWAHLENELSLILGALLRDGSMALSSAVYFAPPNTETRMTIVSNTLKMALGGSPHFEDKITPAWARFTATFSRKKNVRNQVAHGQIGTVFLNGKNTVRLTSPMFDFMRIGGKLSQGKLPGLGANEIRQSAEAVVRLSNEAAIWVSIVNAHYADDGATLLQRLAELPANQSTDRCPPDDH